MSHDAHARYLTGYPGQDITQSQFHSFNIVQFNNVMNATLRINELSPGLIGDYNCSASNVVDGELYHVIHHVINHVFT